MATKTKTIDAAATISSSSKAQNVQVAPNSIRVRAWEVTVLPLTAAGRIGLRVGDTGDIVPLQAERQGYLLDKDEQAAGLNVIVLDPAVPASGNVTFTLAVD